MNIPDKMRSLREMHHLTQEEIAEKLNISHSTYAKLERGEQKIHIEKLQQIAQIFNMEIKDFFTDTQKVVLLINENGDYSANYYSSNEAIIAELDKAKATIQFQEKLLESNKELLLQKDNEINALKEIIALMKK